MSATDTQVGGNHYKHMKIQPIDFILANNLGFCEANVVKYVSRWKTKGGVEDLLKARHYIDLLLEQLKRTSAESQRAVTNDLNSAAALTAAVAAASGLNTL